jgi:diaminopimelate epimerase
MSDPREVRPDERVKLNGRSWRLSRVDTGVPHTVVLVDRLDQVDVERLGRQLRHHQRFQPRGTNVDFVEANPRNRRRLRIRTYERGVEGETLACGTGVTAAAVIHALRLESDLRRRNGRSADHRIEVQTRSGETLTVTLTVTGQGRRRRVTGLTLTGAVRWVCQGVFAWSPTGKPGASRPIAEREDTIRWQ